MSLLSLTGIAKSYGSRLVLDGLELHVPEEARIGVVGPNGSGKSTLLRLAAGLEEPDAGELARRRGLRVAHLPQLVEGDGRTPLQTALDARPDVAELDRELHAVAARLGTPEAAADLDLIARLLARQEALLARFTALGGPGLEGRARAHLVALGIDGASLELPTTALSGGERKLAALAACLLRDPDLLILDEPEAHLDADHRAALEELLRGFEGAVLVVSHDRYLLDETVGEIAELDRGRIRMWPGNYSAYAVAREVELRRRQELWVTQQKEIARLEEAVRRFRHWAHIVEDERHARQARNVQRRIDAMEKIERPALERRRIALALRAARRGGTRVAELRGAGIDFGGGPVLDAVHLVVLHGERIGVVGDNGAGKSVLLKLLAGALEPTAGEVLRGPSIRVGYLAQEHETLDPGSTPLAAVRAARPGTEGEAVAALMKFLFAYEQVRRPIRTLSGGERTRLQLLLLMLGGANLLLLDEPTNHLDIESVEALEAALEGFDGTVVTISHDRYFLDRIADRIVEVGGGGIREHEGGYSSWVERRAA